MKRRFIISLLMLSSCLLTEAYAQKHSLVAIEKGEKWYGAMTALGSNMPFTPALGTKSLSRENFNNQTVPFLVSSYGRYVIGEFPFDFRFTESEILIDSQHENLAAVRVGKTLREAYILARNKFFPGSGQTPNEIFFKVPQYNTWIELMYNQNQSDVENYAQAIIDNGFTPGILMIDDNWQRYYGNFDFKAERFPDPAAMTDRLHKQGFKVMLWVSPFVSADSPEFRELQQKGYLIKQKDSDRAAIICWWNGYSGCFDLTNPEAMKYLTDRLKETQSKYGVDGFKFDAGDPQFYDPTTQDYFKKDALPTDHTLAWAQLGLNFEFNEYRACWKMQGEPLVQRLGDKDYSWNALNLLIPEMVNAGLMGYAYTCPDMIGGGQFGSFLNVDQTKMDQALIVRSAQLHSMMPMMQFSVAPWRILDKEHLQHCINAAKLHEQFAPYILELAKESAKTGEPIIRSMEYMFPHKGFSECVDQFMIGSKYLVAPILTADGKRSVRLPQGTWIDDQGKKFRGPLVLPIQADMGRIPYFQKK